MDTNDIEFKDLCPENIDESALKQKDSDSYIKQILPDKHLSKFNFEPFGNFSYSIEN